MWICSQIGSREHYAVPRALHRGGEAATLYTDFWAGPITRAVTGRVEWGAIRSLATRYHQELNGRQKLENGSLVRSWNFHALWWEAQSRRKRKSESGNVYQNFIEVGHRFAVLVCEALKRRSDLGPDCIFFAYDTGALEALKWCREQGIKCVLNQMDPNRVEVELVRAEEQRWPGWKLKTIQVPEEYFARREQEWALADRVVVNSEFSRQALLQQGVPAEKLVVVPLCYEANADALNVESRNEVTDTPPPPRPASGHEQVELRVLFLGQVILRKGIQYLLAAARKLEREKIHFDVVGPIGISREAMATAPGNVTFHGRTGRDQAAGWYRRSQVFVLPTLSDGFAITQLEAMAHGLPVIATPCCGEVVSNGVDGFVVPASDPDSLVAVLKRYLSEPGLLEAHRSAALEKSKQFTLQRLTNNLLNLQLALMKK